MARPYATEMAKLGETFDWAAAVDIQPLRQAVRTAGLSPLRAVGSGGSFTAAHALAGFHQRFTRRIAAVATPRSCVRTDRLNCGHLAAQRQWRECRYHRHRQSLDRTRTPPTCGPLPAKG